MRRSTNTILTTHVGSLPGPADVWNKDDVSDTQLESAVASVVRMQKEAGVDLINEGELTKPHWVLFMASRLSGFGPVVPDLPRFAFTANADWQKFSDFYSAAVAKGTLFEQTGSIPEINTKGREQREGCVGPISYVGHEAIKREIEMLVQALGDTPSSDAFLTTVAPASIEPVRPNAFYKTDEDYLFALADALAVEYEAIAAAGLIVQVDDAFLAARWESIGIKMGLEAYRRFCEVRVEALNHALRNVPQEQVRYHLCWGSWHGPHAFDLPLKDIVDILMKVNAGAYLIEAANARHEHEYHVWETVKLPSGKILMPGVVSHATSLIEHPELVAERIQRFVRLLGKENVIASTDCGLGSRTHPQIAVAKLESLVKGAALASKAV